MASFLASLRSRLLPIPLSKLRPSSSPNDVLSLTTNYYNHQPWSGSVRWFSWRRHKRLLKHSKGFRGRAKNCFSIAIRRVEKSWQYAYRDRKARKRNYRKLWIMRINAACRQYNVRYSRFVAALKFISPLNRKVLSEMAATEPFAFKAVLDVVQQQQQIFEEKRKAEKLLQDDETAEDQQNHVVAA